MTGAYPRNARPNLVQASFAVALGCGVLSIPACDDTTRRPGELEIMSWDDFLKMSTKTFDGKEIYAVDGDIAVSPAEVRPYYDKLVANIKEYNQGIRDGLSTIELDSTVNTIGTADDVWAPNMRGNLTFCVSDEFGADKALIQTAIAGATADLEAVGHYDFRYVASQDATCNNTNASIVFSVRPWTSGGACSFFPSGGGCVPRTLVITVADFFGTVTHRGVLRHELGHILGLRHEHIRFPGTFCTEGGTWRAVTSYDSQSMMHYPSCPGSTNVGDLQITTRDAQGLGSLYAAVLGQQFFTADFTGAAVPSAASCTQWNDFRSRLDGDFTSVMLSGSANGTGVSCSSPEIATQICNALGTGTPLGISCGGHTWNVGECGGTAVAVDAGVCTCPASGAQIVRPCIGNANWGGMGTATCGGPTQSLEVRCMRGTETVYASNFNQNVTPDPLQCSSWNSFRGSVPSNADFARLSGTADPEGVLCGDPAAASQICNALKTGGTVTGLACGANSWNVGECGGTAVAVNSSVCSCPASGASIARPCIANPNWGGMLTATCGGPSQSLRVSCGTAPRMFSNYFPLGTASAGLCSAWEGFRASLTGAYSKITLRGSTNPDGVTCTGATANTLCQAVHSGGTVTGAVCDGNSWNVGACGGTAVSVNSAVCSCTASGAQIVRPCIANPNWGGMGTATCSSPGQSMDVICE